MYWYGKDYTLMKEMDMIKITLVAVVVLMLRSMSSDADAAEPVLLLCSRLMFYYFDPKTALWVYGNVPHNWKLLFVVKNWFFDQ